MDTKVKRPSADLAEGKLNVTRDDLLDAWISGMWCQSGNTKTISRGEHRPRRLMVKIFRLTEPIAWMIRDHFDARHAKQSSMHPKGEYWTYEAHGAERIREQFAPSL